MDRPAGAQGVIYATGTENSGASLFVQNDRLVFDYNCFGNHEVVESDRPVPEGASVLGVEFRRTGRGGTATLMIDGEPAGVGEIEFVMFMMSSIGPSVGFDHGSPVSDRYSSEFPFEGALHQVDIQLIQRKSDDSSEAETEARSTMSRQ